MAPDLQHGQVVQQIIVNVYQDNAMSVHGPMDDPAWMVAALENAADAVRNQSRPKTELIIPGKDVKIR